MKHLKIHADRPASKATYAGFTIIEILIVLAIASLILTIIFLAVPQLQRNSRNNARKHDVSLILSAISDCLATNNGSISTCSNPSNINLSSSDLSIFTGFHYGYQTSAPTDPPCGKCLTPDGSCPNVNNLYACPPTADQPNYGFNLTCNSTGTWFGTPTVKAQFAVTYEYESGNGQYSNRCVSVTQ